MSDHRPPPEDRLPRPLDLETLRGAAALDSRHGAPVGTALLAAADDLEAARDHLRSLLRAVDGFPWGHPSDAYDFGAALEDLRERADLARSFLVGPP